MPKTIDPNEWYFEECPIDEIDYCWTYEYARESEFLRTIIAKWRQGAKGNKIEEYIALDEEIYAEPLGSAVYPFFPFWPNKPYLSIDPKTRNAWLDRLGMPLEPSDAPPYQIQARYWSKESTLKMLERFIMARSLSFRNGSSQWVVFHLDWNLHDKELATMFRRWLKENRPEDVKAFEMRGRGNPARQGRANLKYLSAYRLRKKMSRNDAIAFLEEEGGKLKPYRNYQDWDLALDRAKAIIQSLEDHTFIVPRDEEFLHGPIGEKLLKAAGLQCPLF